MNLLQLGKVTPFTQGIGIAGDNYEMLKRLATNRGAPAMQQNGMGLNTANSTPVSMIPTPQFPQTSSNANAPVIQSNGANTNTTDTTNTELRRENIDTPQQNQTDPKQVSDFANSLYSSLGKGLTYTNPTAGGSAIDQLSALQAQQANDKVNRTGMYAIDKNAGFSPQQVSQQEGSADQFYTEQKGKYGSQAQQELAGAKKTDDLTPYQKFQATQAISKDTQLRTDSAREMARQAQLIDQSFNNIVKGGDRSLNTQAIITAFNKILDPVSVVRESEYDRTAQGQSLIARLQGKVQNISEGGAGVTEETLKEAASIGKMYLEGARKSIELQNKRAQDMAAQFGLNPDFVTSTYQDESEQVDIPDNPTPGTVWQAPDGTKYEFKNGAWDESFNSVGNTQVSIPQSSRISYVNNNPGNLVYAGQEGAKRGEKRSDGTYWAKFSTPDAGFNALQNQVKLDASRGLTLNSFINKYAPSSENDTKTYVAQVSQRLGVDPRTPISQIDTRELAKEIARKESNTRIS